MALEVMSCTRSPRADGSQPSSSRRPEDSRTTLRCRSRLCLQIDPSIVAPGRRIACTTPLPWVKNALTARGQFIRSIEYMSRQTGRVKATNEYSALTCLVRPCRSFQCQAPQTRLGKKTTIVISIFHGHDTTKQGEGEAWVCGNSLLKGGEEDAETAERRTSGSPFLRGPTVDTKWRAWATGSLPGCPK